MEKSAGADASVGRVDLHTATADAAVELGRLGRYREHRPTRDAPRCRARFRAAAPGCPLCGVQSGRTRRRTRSTVETDVGSRTSACYARRPPRIPLAPARPQPLDLAPEFGDAGPSRPRGGVENTCPSPAQL